MNLVSWGMQQKRAMRSLVVIITFIWLGMVLGSSFLEAPLKFTSPNITLPLGLGIGKIVFGALNKVEILFSIVLMVCFVIGKFPIGTNYLFIVVVLVVLLQTIWLIPALNNRADLIISGEEVPKTYHHITFVVLEFTKTIFLLFAGIRFLRSWKRI